MKRVAILFICSKLCYGYVIERYARIAKNMKHKLSTHCMHQIHHATNDINVIMLGHNVVYSEVFYLLLFIYYSELLVV